MEFRIAKAAAKTGRLLLELVGDNPTNAVICYGLPYSGSLPALNIHCGRLNKLEQAQRLREALNIWAINPLNSNEATAFLQERNQLLLGRKSKHSKGTDIVPALEEWQISALSSRVDFFTPYISSTGEYRTWIYRNRHLGSYRKVLQYPDQYKRIGRNYDNGFRFERVENAEVPDMVKELGRKAIAALDLDFGAVDMLITDDADTPFVVLEVNSAPGVADERRAVIQNLAHRIQRWAANGCPGRSNAQ